MAIELEKMVKRPLFLFFVGLLVGVLLFLFLGGLVFGLTSDLDSKIFVQRNLAGTAGVELALSLGKNLGGFSLLILTAAIATSAYQWRTLHLYLSHGVGRTILLGAQLTALAAIALLFVLVSLVLGLILGVPLTIPMGGEVTLAGISSLVWQTPRILLSMLPCIAIAFPIAILTRSIAATNTITVLYVYILEPILTNVGKFSGEPLSRLTVYLPFQLTQFLVGSSQTDLVDPNLAAFGVILWVIVLASAAWFIFRQQDLTS